MRNLFSFFLSLIFINILITPGNTEVYDLDRGLEELAKRLVEKVQLPPRARLAVVSLVDHQNRETRFGNFVAEELTTKLFGYGRFDLVERQLLDKAIKEIKLQDPKAGITDPKTAIKLGKLLNAEAILVGSYEDLGFTRKINARIISVSLGTIVSAAGVELEKVKLPPDEVTPPSSGDEKGAVVRMERTIYFGGDWLTVIFDSIELVEGRFLRFNFTVRNPFEDEVRLRLDRPQENTYIVDNYGNSYDYVSTQGIDANHDRQIKPGERVRFSIVVKAPRPPANYITLRTEWTAQGRNVFGTKKFVEKNLPVPGQ